MPVPALCSSKASECSVTSWVSKYLGHRPVSLRVLARALCCAGSPCTLGLADLAAAPSWDGRGLGGCLTVGMAQVQPRGVGGAGDGPLEGFL